MPLGLQGHSQDFSKGGGGGGVTLCQTDIVMPFSPRNIVGCLLKKRFTKGGSRAPEDPPSYALGLNTASNATHDKNTSFGCYSGSNKHKRFNGDEKEERSACDTLYVPCKQCNAATILNEIRF